VELGVADIETAFHFYTEVFGFELVSRSDDRVVLETPGGRGSIALRVAGALSSTAAVTLSLEIVDPASLANMAGLVERHGGTVLAHTTDLLGGPTALVADPDGHHIVL
jgi:predicted enzyme related to lactoylglutathione lyase